MASAHLKARIDFSSFTFLLLLLVIIIIIITRLRLRLREPNSCSLIAWLKLSQLFPFPVRYLNCLPLSFSFWAQKREAQTRETMSNTKFLKLNWVCATSERANERTRIELAIPQKPNGRFSCSSCDCAEVDSMSKRENPKRREGIQLLIRVWVAASDNSTTQHNTTYTTYTTRASEQMCSILHRLFETIHEIECNW